MSSNFMQMEEDIKRCCQDAGHTLIAERPLTAHRDDWYLKVILAEDCNTGLCTTWIYNAQMDTLFEGHYDMDSTTGNTDFFNRR